MNTDKIDLVRLREKVNNMTEQEKEMFLDNYRKSKGWSVEDEQRIIKNIKDSGIVEKIKNLNEKLERMMYESRNSS